MAADTHTHTHSYKHVQSTTSHFEQRKPFIQILSMQHTTPEEVAKHIGVM